MAMPTATGGIVVCCYMYLGVVPNEAEERQQQTAEIYLVRVDAMGDGSQVPSKATRHSTAQTCHTRMVLPAAAGRGSVVTL